MSNLRNTVHFLNIIQLVNYIKTFLFSYRVFQERSDRKNPNIATTENMTLLIDTTPGGSFTLTL